MSTILSSVSHVNIVKFFGYSLEPMGLLFELCQLEINGEIFFSVIDLLEMWNDENIFTLEKRLNIVQQATTGLEVLHKKQIVHRDFKPANLLVSGTEEDVVVKITDFDFIVEVKTNHMFTATKTLVNEGCTLAYAAPEMCFQKVMKPTFACDIYSWGITTFEIMSGTTPPWHGVISIYSDAILLEALKEKKRPLLNHLEEKYKEENISCLIELIQICFSEDSRSRPPIVEVKETLCKILNDTNILSIQKEDGPLNSSNANYENNKITKIDTCNIDDIPRDLKSNSQNSKANNQEKDKHLISSNSNYKSVEMTEDRKCSKADVTGDENVQNNETNNHTNILSIQKEDGRLNSSTANYESYILEDHNTCNKDDTPEVLNHNSENSKTNNDTDILSIQKEDGPLNSSNANYENNKTTKLNMCNKDDIPGDLNCNFQNCKANVTKKKIKACTKLKKKIVRTRPCLYCGILQTDLRLHLKRKHKNEDRVKKALKCKRAKRIQMFEQIRKDGILKYNLNEIKKENPKLQHERIGLKVALTIYDLVMCTHCNGFYCKTSFRRHRKRFSKSNDVPQCISSIQIGVCNDDLSDSFKSEVLATLRNDDIGCFVRENPLIIRIGTFLFDKVKRKVNKKVQVVQSVRNDMRKIAYLYRHFLNESRENSPNENDQLKYGDIRDLFLRENFFIFKKAVEDYTMNDVEKLKAGLKHNLYYLIKNCCKILKGLALVQKNDYHAKELENFETVLKLYKDDVFGDAAYKINNDRLTRLRKPQELPSEDDVRKLRKYLLRTLKQMTSLSAIEITQDKYILLRDVLCARLTLYNTRRGGEPARLTLTQGREALNRDWEPRWRLEKIDSLSASSESKMITFQEGKGNNSSVGVIIPEDCVKALRKLQLSNVRHQGGVSNSNRFLFASTKKSSRHITGWKAIYNCCKKADVTDPSKLTATKHRHRNSTMFASMDVPLADRERFYSHMGHSAQINKEVYQAPAVDNELNHVANYLDELDQGLDRKSQAEDSCPEEYLSEVSEDEAGTPAIDISEVSEDEENGNPDESPEEHVAEPEVYGENLIEQGIPLRPLNMKSPKIIVSPFKRRSIFMRKRDCLSSDEENFEPVSKSYKLRPKRVKKKLQTDESNENDEDSFPEGSDSDSDFDPTALSEQEPEQRARAKSTKYTNVESFKTFMDNQKQKWCGFTDEGSGKRPASNRLEETPRKIEKKNHGSKGGRKYSPWTPVRNGKFFEEFSDFISGKDWNKYPTKKEMQGFIKKTGIDKDGFDVFTVRTKVVNEKKKHQRILEQRKNSLGISKHLSEQFM